MNKEILLALSILILPSTLVGIGLNMILGIPWWAVTLAGIGSQLFYHFYKIQVKDTKIIKKSLERYDNLQYKKYLIPLTCQGCGRENNVELDLTNTEFKCKFCEVENAIYINFATATKTNPLYDLSDVVANAS